MADEFAGGAPAPAESISTPDTQSNTPAPIAESTPRSAIDRAFDAVEAQERGEPAKPAPKQDAEPVATQTTDTDRTRNPDGTFAAKEPAKDGVSEPEPTVDATKPDAAATDAPSRFSPDAKAAWKDAPEPIKAEVNRAIRELEQGIERYRGDATTYNEVFRPFVDMATRSNLDPQHQLNEYVKIDMALAQDFNSGIGMIFKNAGINPREWAAQVVGQPSTPADQQQGAQDRVIQQLQQEISNLRQGFNGVHQTLEQQRQGQIGQSLESFTGTLPEGDRALFLELDGEIARYLQDPSITLADAFAKAKTDAQTRYQRMFGNPASSAPPVAKPAAPDLTAQTRKGQLSVTGAPGAGSNPDTRKPPSSPRAAIDGAFASLGL